jgi:hypothetical protein
MPLFSDFFRSNLIACIKAMGKRDLMAACEGAFD